PSPTIAVIASTGSGWPPPSTMSALAASARSRRESISVPSRSKTTRGNHQIPRPSGRVRGLVERAQRARGVLDHAVAAAAVAARGGDKRAAEALAFLQAVIEILDRDVDQPDRRQSGVAAAGVADAGDRRAVGLHHEVP